MTESPTDWERTKWEEEHQLKRDELVLKARELDIRERESRRARWSNPLVLALAGAALAAAGNVVATFYTGLQQRRTEAEKAESQLILEVIKTSSTEKAAENLKFLVEVSLISDEARSKAITTYLGKERPKGTGVALPASTAAAESTGYPITVVCTLRSANVKAVIDTLDRAVANERYIITSSAEQGVDRASRTYHTVGPEGRRTFVVMLETKDGSVHFTIRTVVPSSAYLASEFLKDLTLTLDKVLSDVSSEIPAKSIACPGITLPNLARLQQQ